MIITLLEHVKLHKMYWYKCFHKDGKDNQNVLFQDN